jgi:hypothetical protein
MNICTFYSHAVIPVTHIIFSSDINGGNKPTFPHQPPVAGCVNMDASTVSVFLTTAPRQVVTAFTMPDCNAGENGQFKHLGYS